MEIHSIPEGKPVETYADGKIHVFAGHAPKTTFYLPESDTHVVIHKFGPFEFNKEGEVNEVLVRRGHHKSHLAVAFNDTQDKDSYGYNVWSPEGIIGRAFGRRLDLLIASLFHDDPKLNELIKDTGMDKTVSEYLESLINPPEGPKHTA